MNYVSPRDKLYKNCSCTCFWRHVLKQKVFSSTAFRGECLLMEVLIFKIIPFLTNVFLATYLIIWIQRAWSCAEIFSAAKQVDAQRSGMWICAFSALCTCFCVQRSFNAVTAQMAHFPWLPPPGGGRMSWRYSTQEHCCHYTDLNETSVSELQIYLWCMNGSQPHSLKL